MHILIPRITSVCSTLVALNLALSARAAEPVTTNAPPDYTSDYYWAAINHNPEKPFDVFYVHPTTYGTTNDGYNASLFDQEVRDETDATTRAQVTVFKNKCNIYAPRYRQVSIAVLSMPDSETEPYYAVAKEDVLAAFNYYLEHYNNGRPYFLASHSQGSDLTLRLLKSQRDLVKDDQLMGAYLIGWTFTDSDLEAIRIPLATTPSQIGGLVTWNTIGPGGVSPTVKPGANCINPLTWTDATNEAPASLDVCAVIEFLDGTTNAFPNFTSAHITEEGTLEIPTPTAITNQLNMSMGENVYHRYDYAFFYSNLVENVELRCRTWSQQGVYQDFDGDAKADVAVCWLESGCWYILQSSDMAERIQAWGWADSTPVPGDYDGDGKYDTAVYDATSGMWYILQSSIANGRLQAWGWEGAVAVPADYDGDGITDVAVYDPTTGSWLILQSSTGSGVSKNWGWNDGVPVPGDYDGDGKADIAVYWPEGGQWYILQSSDGQTRIQPWGWADAEACQGDFDGDGKTDVAVYWPETGWWNILQSSDGQARTQNWGWNQAMPAPADYDGDEKYDVTVYWPIEGDWYIWQSRTMSSRTQPWGWNQAAPVNSQFWINSVE